jgi:hypothetical protein
MLPKDLRHRLGLGGNVGQGECTMPQDFADAVLRHQRLVHEVGGAGGVALCRYDRGADDR